MKPCPTCTRLMRNHCTRVCGWQHCDRCKISVRIKDMHVLTDATP